MEWMTVKEAAMIWGISNRRATILCADGRVKGAQKLGNFWVVPKGTPKPIDGRTKVAKAQKERKQEIEV
jgi:hypothetical protein